MHTRHIVMTVTVLALLSPNAAIVRTDEVQHAGHGNHGASGPLPEAVRAATERFRDVNAAIAEGYVRNGGCVSGPEEGAMGVHFAKPAFFDDVLKVTEPEVLVYEPRKDGLQLVAAEYVTPAEVWNKTHGDPDRPHLMEHLFHFVPGPNRYGPAAFYELHVWAWKHNPRGSFADWNPTVSCADWPAGS